MSSNTENGSSNTEKSNHIKNRQLPEKNAKNPQFRDNFCRFYRLLTNDKVPVDASRSNSVHQNILRTLFRIALECVPDIFPIDEITCSHGMSRYPHKLA